MSNNTIVYTDGSCRGNPGPMGIGVVIIPDINNTNSIVKMGKYIGHGTNNIAELTAIKIGIETAIQYNKPILLYTDSLYHRHSELPQIRTYTSASYSILHPSYSAYP